MQNWDPPKPPDKPVEGTTEFHSWDRPSTPTPEPEKEPEPAALWTPPSTRSTWGEGDIPEASTPPEPEPEKKPAPRKPSPRVRAAKEVASAEKRLEKAEAAAEEAHDAQDTLAARAALRADPEGPDAAFVAKIRSAKTELERETILGDAIYDYRKYTDAVTWEQVDHERVRLIALIETFG